MKNLPNRIKLIAGAVLAILIVIVVVVLNQTKEPSPSVINQIAKEKFEEEFDTFVDKWKNQDPSVLYPSFHADPNSP